MVTYAPRRSRIEAGFVLVYVFCEYSDTVRYMAPASAWCVFPLEYTDEGKKVQAMVFASAFNASNGMLQRPRRPTSQISQKCRSLLGADFKTRIEESNLRAYPVLFAKLRHAGFVGKTVLIQHHDRAYTLYELAPHGINVRGEKRSA